MWASYITVLFYHLKNVSFKAKVSDSGYKRNAVQIKSSDFKVECNIFLAKKKQHVFISSHSQYSNGYPVRSRWRFPSKEMAMIWHMYGIIIMVIYIAHIHTQEGDQEA